jgi:sugar lactone lactonase YvrE
MKLMPCPLKSPYSPSLISQLPRLKKPSCLLLIVAAGVLATAMAGAQSYDGSYFFTTIAGQASEGSKDGLGAIAQFHYPRGIAADAAGNLFVADGLNHVIRKITPSGEVSTVAGLAGYAGSADGQGSAARFNFPYDVAVGSTGTLYVADLDNDTIRAITPDGNVTTLAGSPGVSGNSDGTGAAARFFAPQGVAVDGVGNVYVADSANSAIRRISANGDVKTFARLANRPEDLALDSSGNIYVADYFGIRKITPAGEISTIASGFEFLTDVAVDANGDIYLADSNSDTVDKITTNGIVVVAGFSGRPYGIAFDPEGNIVAALHTNTIAKASPTGTVTTIAGTSPSQSAGSADGIGAAARFNSPVSVVSDSANNLYVADAGNDVIRKITPAGVVTTFAGTLGQSKHVDGVGTNASFYELSALTIDNSDNIYALDYRTIRKVTPDAVVTTFVHFSTYSATSLAVDGLGNLYVTENKCDLLKITPAGVISTFAGSFNHCGNVDGTGTAARFQPLFGVTVDSSGNVYVSEPRDGLIRKITPAGVVSTFAKALGFALTRDSLNNLFVASNLPPRNQGLGEIIQKITPGGVVSTIGGLLFADGSADGSGSDARFYYPTGITVGPTGRLYIADRGNNTIRLGTKRLETELLAVRSITPVPGGYTPPQWFGIFQDEAASGHAGTYFNANATGDYIAYNVPVSDFGIYHLRAGVQTKADKGIFRLLVNGANQGQPEDEYSTTAGYETRDLGTVVLNPGDQAFKFRVKGKNPSSTGYTLGFDYIELMPTARQETESLQVQSITPTPPGIPVGRWVGIYNDVAASGEAGTYFNANAVGDYITYAATVLQPGTYHVRVGVQTKYDKGLFQLTINGVDVGPTEDEYYPNITYGVRDLGSVSFPTAGTYSLKFTVVGKNPSSTGYTLAFDYIELLP